MELDHFEETLRPVELEDREYSFDLELSNDFYDPYKLHIALYQLCRINIPQTDVEVPIHKMDPTIDTGALISERQGLYDDQNSKDRIKSLFESIAVMCDPYTQPWDIGEENILSLDYVSDIVIGSIYEEYLSDSGLSEFDIAFDAATIVEKILHILNCDDENILQSVKNDEDDWKQDLNKWLPHNSLSSMIHIASDFHHLMLLYTMVVVCLLIIYKCYAKSSNSNICLNPFLRLYLQIWKNMTRVIFLGIEIDRRDEEQNFPGYPEAIRYMIKGASAIRSITSLILNDEFVKREHDLKHEPLLNFMHPYGRKFRNGSIKTDMRVFVAALLALGSELEDVIELLFSFEPEDEYDEDIKYMFEMELENMEEFERIDNTNGKPVGEDEYHKRHLERVNQYLGIERHDKSPIVRSLRSWEVHPDCECTFDSDEEDGEFMGMENDSKYTDDEQSSQTKVRHEDLEKELERQLELIESGKQKERPNDSTTNEIDFTEGLYAIRNSASKRFEIDSQGRDWRDIPRGDNRQLDAKFIDLLKQSQLDSNIFITPVSNLLEALSSLTIATQPSEICEKIIRSIAWVVQYEFEASMMSTEQRLKNSDSSINTDVIYEYLKQDDNFESMMKFNPSASFSIIDELLMVEGYRRVLIWFLTHLTLNQWLINYFHDLLAGLRGNPSLEGKNDVISLRYNFSRVGALILSEMEKSMLLHEFFSNAVIYLSRGSSFEFEDLMLDGVSSSPKTIAIKQESTENDASKFITTRFNAQKLIKVICLVLKSLQSRGILKINDPEYRVEIQTLLIQWVGVGLVPEAKELFFAAGLMDTTKQDDNKPQEDLVYDPPLVRNTEAPATSTKISQKIQSSTISIKSLTPLQQKLDKMEGLKLFRLFHHTLSVDTFELLTTILHLGAHYTFKKEEIVSFVRDLNSVEQVYPNKDIEKICDLVFTEIGSNIDSGDEENVVEIAFAAGIVSPKASVIWVRKIVNEYMQGEVGFGEDPDFEEDNKESKDGGGAKKKHKKKKKKNRKT